MFENINPLDRSTAWLEIFLLMLGAFLIGYFFAKWFYKSKMQRKLDDCETEKKELKLQNLEHANSTFPSGIKAVKTRGRKGELVSLVDDEIKKEEETSLEIDDLGLNFESFGTASEEDADDLKLISGIGPFIEKKLNGIGIYTYSQISRFTKQDIEDVTEAIKFFPGRIERDDWVKQAEKLLK